MNTVKHKTTTVTKHEIVMEGDGWGTVTRRDYSDFIFQVENKYEEIMGHKPASDDAYMVRGNEEGLRAFWESHG